MSLETCYAWQLEGGDLCCWAEPSRAKLESREKPSPGARVRRVRIVLESEYLATKRISKEADRE